MPTEDASKQRQHNSNSFSSTEALNRADNDKSPGFDDSSSSYNRAPALNGYSISDEHDTTLVSNTSTLIGISGDTNTTLPSNNRCAELERLIEGLRLKLDAKDKELTDMQLKQWSTDYQNDQLKSTIGRLEKENAQLKAMIVNMNKTLQ